MPVLVGDKVVQHDHLIHRVFHTLHTQRLAAVQIVAVDRCVVVFPHGLHHAPRADKLRVRRNEILTDTVGRVIIPQQRMETKTVMFFRASETSI